MTPIDVFLAWLIVTGILAGVERLERHPRFVAWANRTADKVFRLEGER